MLNERGEISPFGWAISYGGRGPGQLRDDVRHVEDWSIGAWTRHFPLERGYEVAVERSASNAQGLVLTVRRGEFHARASLEHDVRQHERGRGSASVRMFGRAEFEAVRQAHVDGDRMVARSRALGWGGGFGVFLSLAWLMVGVRDPIFVLGGMLLVVALLMTVMAGGTLGAWFGERLAQRSRERAQRQVDADPGIRDDIRRWKAIAKQLASQRAMLLGTRRQPFRSEPRAMAG